MSDPVDDRRDELDQADPAEAEAELLEPGSYVAAEPLFVAGAVLAHAVGDPVPTENIVRNGWLGKVVRVDGG